MSWTPSAVIPPDLPPDIRFSLLPKTRAASERAFEIKCAAIGPYIRARWTWDEAFQRNFHEQRFALCPLLSILRAGEPVGTVALTRHADFIQLDEFYLLPAHHGQGLGSSILRHCLSLADEMNLPVRLRYLQWNPVGTLYRRHGFEEIGQTDIHFLMERAPAQGTKPDHVLGGRSM